MDINRANIEAMFRDFEVSFTEGMNSYKANLLAQIAMTIPSSSASMEHAWLRQLPRMREWVGDRQVKNLNSQNFNIANKKYEATLEIPREDVEDDKYMLYKPAVNLMGLQAASNPDVLAITTLITNDNWGGDAAAFFGTSRTYDGTNTISNYATGALAEGTFNTAIQAMQSYIGANGYALGVQPSVLLVGPALRSTAFDLCVNDFYARANSAASAWVSAQNPNKGLVTPLVTPELVGTYANYWFILGAMGPIRGVVYQDRVKAEIQTQRMEVTSDYVFSTDKFQVGARARGAAFKGLPHLIYGGYVSA